MNAVWLVIIGIVLFYIAYKTYGSYLANQWGVSDKTETPAHTKEDGVDYVPAKAP
ncbi:carbon starvation CstA family protein, partial [Pyramidobacter sp. C12-8]